MAGEYNKITSMEGLAHIRSKPGMYVGSVSSDDGHMPQALVQIFQEAVSNAVDEALAGFGDTINITVHEDNSVTIQDFGRGIPMGEDFDDVIRSFTKLNSSGKFDSQAYEISAGTHGIGSKAVVSLSEYVQVSVVRKDVAYNIRFVQKDVTHKESRKPKRGEQTGTTITFLPDDTVFDMINWDGKQLARKLKSQSYLTPQVTYNFLDERDEDAQVLTYHHPSGIEELVNDVAADVPRVGTTKPVSFKDNAYFRDGSLVGLEDSIKNKDGLTKVGIDVSLLYTEDMGENIIAYTNGIPNPQGGYHVSGASKALHKVIDTFARENKIAKAKDKISPADTREGLIMVVSASIPESIISFEGQTKGSLKTKEAEIAANAIVEKYLGLWTVDNKTQATKVAKQVIDSMKVRETTADMRKASKASKKRTSKSDKLEMSKKLVEASPSAPAEYRELFITEGDSAAGGAVSARIPEVINGKKVLTQGVLPIRGKIINPQGKSLSRVLENTEVITIINVLGTGIGRDFDISKLRYHKIVLTSDADDDGYHIRCLLITLIWKLMPDLIKEGHIYIANPPLFRFKTYVKGKAKTAFALDMDEYETMKKKYKGWDITRMKGLGEMEPSDLGLTTIRRGSRSLTRVTVDDAQEASEAINLWMGGDALKRREFLSQHPALFSNINSDESGIA